MSDYHEDTVQQDQERAAVAHEALASVQSKLKAPKDKRNDFGKYNYRTAEGTLQAVKPLLGRASLTITDTIEEVAGRVYVVATATFTFDGWPISVSAWAREAEHKKGMDEAQITGAASSYARKYALNGLLAIDDSKDDPDANNRHGQEPKVSPPDDLKERVAKAMATLTEIDPEHAKDAKATAWKDASGDSAKYVDLLEKAAQEASK